MSNQMLAVILDGLNSPPFNYNYTLFNLDSLAPQRLLQILSDVLVWIQGTDSIDIRSEAPEQTTVRILNTLRILRYPPPRDLDKMQSWRVDLLNAEKQVVYPILEWIFNDVDHLKERIYLATYLSQMDIPIDAQSPETNRLQQIIEQKMEEFKNLHSRIVETRGDYAQAEDIRADLQSMYEEKEQLQKRIERSKSRVQDRGNSASHLSLATQFRLLAEKQNDLLLRQEEQRNAVINAEQRVNRLERVLHDAKREQEEMDPTKLLAKYRQDIEVNKYLLGDKLKSDLENLNSGIALVKKILSTPTVDQNDIKRFMEQIENLNNDIKELTAQRDTADQNQEDKLGIYRHQAQSIIKRKAITAEQLQSLRQDLHFLEDAVIQKKKELTAKTGKDDFITTTQFKKLQSKIRQKTNLYKKKKAEMDMMTTEVEIMEKTVHTLQKDWEELKEQLMSEGRGIIDEDTRLGTAERPKTAKPQASSVVELKKMIKELNDQVVQRRQKVNEIGEEVAEATTKQKRENEDIMAKENQMKTVQKDHEDEMERIQSDITQFEKDLHQLESKKTKAEKDLELHKWLESNLHDEEGASRASQKLENDRTSTLADIDKLSKQLKDVMSRPDGADQILMWKSLIQLFTVKLNQSKNRKNGDHPIGDNY